MSDHEYDFEPVRGLPEVLPSGETLLWQGSPHWKGLALHAYHVRAIAVYFGVLLVWRVAHLMNTGQSLLKSLAGASWLLLLASTAIGLLLLLAWLGARTTVYTLTDRRVVIRHGIALPMTVNIPFTVIESADVKVHANGAGDIAMQLEADQRLGYLLTWPHIRPWRITRTQPSLRALPAATRVAQVLARALQGLPVAPLQEAASAAAVSSKSNPSLVTGVHPHTTLAA